MDSDNPSGAVNQQERPSSAEWLDDSSSRETASTSLAGDCAAEAVTSNHAVNLESSEAIRKAPSLKQRDEDMVHAS